MEVGVIGVGRMGTAMARNLIKAGHKVYLFDTVPDGPRALEKEGGHVVGSAKDAFRGDVCISMLRTTTRCAPSSSTAACLPKAQRPST